MRDSGIDPEKGGDGFYIRVLHHYVNRMEFTGIRFDDAIRLFLSGFRLPGESQKVSESNDTTYNLNVMFLIHDTF